MSPRNTLSKFGAAIAVPVVAAALLGSAWVLEQRDQARSLAESQVRATVAQSVTIVRTDLRNQLSAATSPTPGSTLVSAAHVTAREISPDVAATARDGGSATLDDTGRVPAIVVPIYADGTPTDTADRRLDIRSFRIVPINMQPVLTRLVPDVGGIAVRGPDRWVGALPKPAPPGSLTFSVDMDITGAPGWDVSAWTPNPGVPAFAWFGLGGALLIGLAIGSMLGVLVRRNEDLARRQVALERDRDAVTGLAPVLQGSLDVGDVIPAVAWHLADNLELAGLSLSTPGDTGERQLFVWGDAPDTSVLPAAGRAKHLATGDTWAVALTRGGRALGVLRVVAGQPLDADRLVSLQTAAELLGSTLANAEAFARQQDLLDRMRSVDELKTIFLATASHELRTPVTAITGFASLLLDQWGTISPERARLLVDRLMANGQRLSSLIEQLLDFSQLERGLPHAADELINLGATVARILGEHDALVAQHQLNVVIENDGLVRGSSSAVERMVTNLVGNAAKYSPVGSRITVTVRCEHDTAELVVDDEGPGVPEADRERIFSRFYRGSGDTVTRTRGAGIGLAIVSEYAAAMSGTARAESSPAGGARLRITFPAVAMPSAAMIEGKIDVEVS